MATGLLLSGCRPPPPARPLTLATTTSVANSGLLDVLVATYRSSHGVDIRTQLVGSGIALRMLGNGDVDLVISHAPGAEEAAVRDHPAWRYRKLMFNDFVLVGPPEDPAAVTRASGIEDAMRRIARSPATFLSRGDKSGTHEREEQLWALAGSRPAPERLVAAGAGMGTTLRAASEAAAYTLTDRATLAQFQRRLQLQVVFEGAPVLLNTYSVIVDTRGGRSDAATALAAWLTDGGGREAIASYRVGDAVVFTPWPAGRPREHPRDRPD